jgi:hypothetical protein
MNDKDKPRRKTIFLMGNEILNFQASSEKATGATKREDPTTICIKSSELNE